MSIYRQMDEEETVCLFYGWVTVHYGVRNNGLFSSVRFSLSVVSNSLQPHVLQHTRPPCPSPTPGVHSNSHPSSQWCHPAISSSVIPFSSCPQSLPALESIAAKSLQSCPTLCHPRDGIPPGSPVPGILKARTRSGLPFPSPMHESENCKWSRSVVSDPQQPQGLQPTRLLHP